MARFEDMGDVCGFIITITACTLAVILVTHWVWGPKSPQRPFNPKEEYVSQCTSGDRRMVPNVGSDNPKDWTCVNKDK